MASLFNTLNTYLPEDLSSCLRDWCYPFYLARELDLQKQSLENQQIFTNWTRQDCYELLLQTIQGNRSHELKTLLKLISEKQHLQLSDQHEHQKLALCATQAKASDCLYALLESFPHLKTRPFCLRLFREIIVNNLFFLVRVCWAYWKFDLTTQDLSESRALAEQLNLDQCVKECDYIGAGGVNK